MSKPLRGAAPAVFHPAIEQLHADAAHLFGHAAVELTPERYEERLFSYLLLAGVKPAGSQSATSHIFIKVYKVTPERLAQMKQRVAEDYQVHTAVRAHMAGLSNLGTVRPLACYPEDLTIVTERAPGETLLDYMLARAAWRPGEAQQQTMAAAMDGIGRWIRAFQTFQSGTNLISIDAHVEYVDVRLRRLVDHGVFVRNERERLLTRLRELGARVPASDLREVALHADLATTNILVAGPRVTVLDFAMASRGSYLHDISRLSMQIGMLRAKPHYRPAVIERLQHALLRGLDPGVSMAHPLFRFLSILHHVNHYGTLSLKPEPFPGRIFSWQVRRIHRAWLEREMRAAGTADAA